MWEKETYLNKSILDLLLGLLLAGCLLALFILASAGSQIRDSDIYLKPNSYANYVNNDAITFVFGVRNYEAGDTNYLVEAFAGEHLLNREFILVKRGASFEKAETLPVPTERLNLNYPVKFRLTLSKPGPTEKQTVFYWLKGTR